MGKRRGKVREQRWRKRGGGEALSSMSLREKGKKMTTRADRKSTYYYNPKFLGCGDGWHDREGSRERTNGVGGGCGSKRTNPRVKIPRRRRKARNDKTDTHIVKQCFRIVVKQSKEEKKAGTISDTEVCVGFF